MAFVKNLSSLMSFLIIARSFITNSTSLTNIANSAIIISAMAIVLAAAKLAILDNNSLRQYMMKKLDAVYGEAKIQVTAQQAAEALRHNQEEEKSDSDSDSDSDDSTSATPSHSRRNLSTQTAMTHSSARRFAKSAPRRPATLTRATSVDGKVTMTLEIGLGNSYGSIPQAKSSTQAAPMFIQRLRSLWHIEANLPADINTLQARQEQLASLAGFAARWHANTSQNPRRRWGLYLKDAAYYLMLYLYPVIMLTDSISYMDGRESKALSVGPVVLTFGLMYAAVGSTIVVRDIIRMYMRIEHQRQGSMNLGEATGGAQAKSVGTSFEPDQSVRKPYRPPAPQVSQTHRPPRQHRRNALPDLYQAETVRRPADTTSTSIVSASATRSPSHPRQSR